ncbi:uncharacterized protein LOC135469219 [Liolophura sinensis]|uniref:uncharacterized protein LOC135469219 n=1 Tax=Liolophura sinensis TaxID=3198878 RepID=UPI0031596F32
MPSSIQSLDYSRSYTFQLDDSPRYGNFQNLDHLPAVGKGGRAGEHYIPYFTNQHIFKTVSDWVESWQPWQQEVLLIGIADRLPVRQIDVLATTLEPVCHRDYVTACRHQYPSTPFLTVRQEQEEMYAGEGKSDILNENDHVSVVLGEVSQPSSSCRKDGPTIGIGPLQQIPTQPRTSSKSQLMARGGRGEITPSPVVPGGRGETTPSPLVPQGRWGTASSPVPFSVQEFAKRLSNDIIKSALQFVFEKQNVLCESSSNQEDVQFQPSSPSLALNDNVNQEISGDSKSKDHGNETNEKKIDKCCTVLSSDIMKKRTILSPINSAPNALSLDVLFPELDSATDLSHVQSKSEGKDLLVDVLIAKTDFDKKDLSNADGCLAVNVSSSSSSAKSSPNSLCDEIVLSSSQIHNEFPSPCPSKSAESYQAHKSSLLQTDQKTMTIPLAKQVPNGLSQSLDFIGDWKVPRLSRSTNISYSPFKNHLGYFHVNTPDFFGKTPHRKLGPLQTSLDLTDNRQCLSDSNVYVPLHRTYKNAKWWPDKPGTGRMYLRARKRELLPHYKQQLQQVWQWLEMWTDFERVAFVKEIIKMTDTDVLTTFANYVQQRLRDSRDINCLPDHTLLQVFSNLSPKDIASTAQVCRRWRYLCASDSLWMVKCYQMGEEEGLGNVNDMVLRAGQGRMGVDWRKAYRELQKIAINAKTGISPLHRPPEDEESNAVADDEEESPSLLQDLPGLIGQITDGVSATVVDIKVKAGTESTILREREQEALVEDSDSDISEDQIALMTDYNYYSADALKAKKRWSNRRGGVKNLPPRLGLPTNRADNPDGQRWSEGPRPLEPVVKQERQKPKEEDLAYDIRPHLRPTVDILGKTKASHSLEWETPAQGKDSKSFQLSFAGQVIGMKRVRKLQGHSGGVLCVHSDQRRLASGGWDRTIRLWDIRSGRSLHKFYGHRGGIHSLVFDNDIMVSGSWDMTIMVWCMKKFTRRLVLHEHKGCVSCLLLHPEFIVSGSHDTTVRVFYRNTLLCYKVITGHTKAVNCLALDGDCVLSGSSDRTLRLTNIHTLQLLQVFEGMQEAVLSVLSRGSLLIGGDSLGRVYFWNKSTGESEAAIQAHDGPVNSIGFWGSRLLTASGDCTMKEWDINTMTAVRCLDGHKGAINQMTVSEKRIVTCSEDGNVRVWDTFSAIPQNKKTSKARLQRRKRVV